MGTIAGDAGSSNPLVPDKKAGVWGESDSGYGVAGTSSTGNGLQGGSISGFGAVGTSETGTGLYAQGGLNAAVLDGTVVVNGAVVANGTATVQVLEITGGADLSESFGCSDAVPPEPGTVMVISEESPGDLSISSRAMDHRVAGVVSGAHGLNAGLLLEGSVSESRIRVALAGRVYCKAEAVSRPIRVGDRLATSHMAGHAMAVPHAHVGHGTILGKALTGLPEGTGFVLLLVNLQ